MDRIRANIGLTKPAGDEDSLDGVDLYGPEKKTGV